uniref:Uncharacterized protein n=1 Tax=Oryza glumipatula TaxID=40148 RepID=A0A0D9YTH9_9ORYZ
MNIGNREYIDDMNGRFKRGSDGDGMNGRFRRGSDGDGMNGRFRRGSNEAARLLDAMDSNREVGSEEAYNTPVRQLITEIPGSAIDIGQQTAQNFALAPPPMC